MPTKKKLPAQMRGDTWTIRVKFSDIENVCDGAASTTAPTKITSATAGFASNNLDQPITLKGAGAQGADYSGKITAVDSGTQVTVCPDISTAVTRKELTVGKAVDITANKLTLTLKTSNGDPDPGVLQAVATVPAGADATAGIGFIAAASDKTKLVAAPATYFYDIQRLIPGSPPVIQTPVYGEIPIIEDTTLAIT